MNKIGCKLTCILCVISLVQCNPPTVRQTTNGPVEGTQRTTFFGNKYYAFRGVPYAEAPITGKDPYTGDEVDRRFKVITIKFENNDSNFA